MAKKMQKFFVGHDRLLEQSMAFTILFFRSRDIREWKKLDKEKRKEMENFSYELVKEIIGRVKPKSLLVGFATYRRLKKHILDEVK
jgi:mRNA-degrading endonuclease RelE of RelBE toxin-antitoxin system